jgi:hypothetical protein
MPSVGLNHCLLIKNNVVYDLRHLCVSVPLDGLDSSQVHSDGPRYHCNYIPDNPHSYDHSYSKRMALC